MNTIERPPFVTVSLDTGLKWRGGAGWRFEEKMDGVWATKQIANLVLVGEQMRDGKFFAFDIVSECGQDLREMRLRERLAILDAHVDPVFYSAIRNPQSAILRPAIGNGAEFLEAVLARGGEGVVAKCLDDPYGQPWHKCKRAETFDLIVTEKFHPSIRLATVDGQDRGFCCARAAFDEIRVGDIVEIAAYSLTKSGKLREPRFVRIRRDKQAFDK